MELWNRKKMQRSHAGSRKAEKTAELRKMLQTNRRGESE